MNTTEILQKTEKLVNGDRDKTHGNKIINHENISRLWSAYLQNKTKLNIILLVKGINSKNPTRSVKKPGTIRRSAAIAMDAPDMIS